MKFKNTIICLRAQKHNPCCNAVPFQLYKHYPHLHPTLFHPMSDQMLRSTDENATIAPGISLREKNDAVYKCMKLSSERLSVFLQISTCP